MLKKLHLNTRTTFMLHNSNCKHLLFRYWFVDREDMELSIRKHEMLEYGEHQGEVYGTKLDSVRLVNS